PETLAMVKAVGDHCCVQIGEFLGECGAIIEKHFSEIGKCALEKLHQRKWLVSYGIRWQTGINPQRWKMNAGVTVSKKKAEIIPWIWGMGKDQAEQIMANNFGEWVIRSTDAELPSGTVALARVPIIVDNAKDFEMPNEEILSKVEQAFSRITKLQ